VKRSAAVGDNRKSSGSVEVYASSAAELDAAERVMVANVARLAAEGWRVAVNRSSDHIYMTIRLFGRRGIGGGALVHERRARLVEIAAAVRAAWKAKP
jgi:hypothetical protein